MNSIKLQNRMDSTIMNSEDSKTWDPQILTDYSIFRIK